ncbi:MAG: alpha/beta hydrolase [Proteobacteria bacterium]|nr:alpha/beta hydrolase [Pseudomonadota bacterium]
MDSSAWLTLALLAVAVAAWLLATSPQAAGVWLALERRRAGLRLRTAQIPGFTLPYLEGGRGEPLLLVHGFGADKDNFTRIAPFLTQRFRVIALDLPGFGAATRDPAARYDIASQVERLRCFIAELGLTRFHLGGNSMGGFIAAQYAANYPAHVQTLWLLDAAGCEGAYDTSVIQRYATEGQTAQPLHERIFQEIGTQSPPLDRLCPAITAPTLIVWGRQDRILNPGVAAHMQALLPHSRCVLLEGVGHMPMVECPRRVAADYIAFVESEGRAERRA